MTGNPEKLVARLGYRFLDETLLGDALTHRSAGSRNNERLEFLGDAVLNFVIAEALFLERSDLLEGDLSRLRASMVNRESLAAIGAELELGDYLVLGGGELKSGGFRRKSILADAVEAIFGAVLIDGGYSKVKRLILTLFADRLRHLPAPEFLKDPKTRLQEHLQGRGFAIPEYTVMAVSGKDHSQVFCVRCKVVEQDVSAEASGSSRRRAEQAAAEKVLQLLHAS